MHVRFVNDARTFADAQLPAFVAKGNFNSSKYELSLAGNIMLRDFKSHGVSYISDRNLNLWLLMDADNTTGFYNISKGEIETGKLKLSAAGSVVYSEKQKQVNLAVTASGSTFGEMISLVPAKYVKSYEGYKFEGKGNISSKIAGVFGNGRLPSVMVRLEMQNGNITERKSGIGLRGVSGLAVYQVQQDGANEMLSISNLKASLGKGFVIGSLSMHGFSAPAINCNLNPSMNLNELQQFLEI
ncbi:MAG: hypothetical protein U0Z17_03120 [Bacteroidales bacterium]